MQKTYFRTTRYEAEIQAVLVVKATEKTITLAATKHQREQRQNLRRNWWNYHATFDEAKAFLIARLQRRIQVAKTSITRDELDLEAVQAATEPKPPQPHV